MEFESKTPKNVGIIIIIIIIIVINDLFQFGVWQIVHKILGIKWLMAEA